MSDEIMTPDKFFYELSHHRGQRYAFVLGNGINYYLKHNATSWKGLLDKFIGDHLENLDFISDARDINCTEAANLIEFFADEELVNNNRAAEMRKKLMTFLAARLNKDDPEKCAMLDAAWKDNYILTTNIDNNIEKYLGRRFRRKIEQHKALPSLPGNGKYLWNIFWGLEDCPNDRNPLDHRHAVWHIHGKLDENFSPSVLFTLTRYVNAIKQVELWDLASKSDWPGRHTWVNIFYNAPLIIAGLGLTNQEVFLRTLLIERKRHLKKEGKTDIQDYYLVRKKSNSEKESDGRAFLRALGFKTVEFKDTEDMYNNISWQTK